jgi:hypothetical protein
VEQLASVFDVVEPKVHRGYGRIGCCGNIGFPTTAQRVRHAPRLLLSGLLTKGRAVLIIQSEDAETFFRRIEVRPLPAEK